MAPLACSDRRLSDITNRSRPQTHPKGLCGTWTYEYKSPYCPYGNQHIQATYTLLSCGAAHQSTIDRYDEGSDYFIERKTSGWGRWRVKTNGELLIICSTMHTTSIGGSVCGDKPPPQKEHGSSSETQLRESLESFVDKYTSSGSLDDIEEEKLRTQMRFALASMPAKADRARTLEESNSSLPPYATAPCQDICESRSSVKSCPKQGALSGLRRMFSRSSRARS